MLLISFQTTVGSCEAFLFVQWYLEDTKGDCGEEVRYSMFIHGREISL